MDLSLSEEYLPGVAGGNPPRLHRDTAGSKIAMKVGGGRKRPDQKTLNWQKTLLEHGYVGRTIPESSTAAPGRPPTSWRPR